MFKGNFSWNFCVTIILFLIIHYFIDQICTINACCINNLLKIYPSVHFYMREKVLYKFSLYSSTFCPGHSRISSVRGLHEPWKESWNLGVTMSHAPPFAGWQRESKSRSRSVLIKSSVRGLSLVSDTSHF